MKSMVEEHQGISSDSIELAIRILKDNKYNWEGEELGKGTFGVVAKVSKKG